MASAQSSLSQLKLLIVSPVIQPKDAPSPFPAFLAQLTSVSPSEDIESFAGYTDHTPLTLRTKYYSKDVSIWCDELPADANPATTSKAAKEGAAEVGNSSEEANLEEWKSQMLSTAAGEVRAVIGGIILILPIDADQDSRSGLLAYIEAAHAFREAVEDESPGREIALVVVLQPHTPPSISNESSSRLSQDLADLAIKISNDCIDNDMFGWDVTSWIGRSESVETDRPKIEERNEFGEKVGMPRVIEILEAVDWSAGPCRDDGADEGEGAEFGGGVGVLGSSGLSDLDSELQQEMLGLKLAMVDDAEPTDDNDSGEDFSVEQMEVLKSRVLAIRDTVAGMPAAQKEAVAKREIDRIMKEL